MKGHSDANDCLTSKNMQDHRPQRPTAYNGIKITFFDDITAFSLKYKAVNFISSTYDSKNDTRKLYMPSFE